QPAPSLAVSASCGGPRRTTNEGATMPSTLSTLVAKREELDAKRKALADVFEAAGPDLDFSKPEVLNALGAKDSAEAVEKVRERNREIEALYDECKKLAEIEEIKNRVAGEVDLPAG